MIANNEEKQVELHICVSIEPYTFDITFVRLFL